MGGYKCVCRLQRPRHRMDMPPCATGVSEPPRSVVSSISGHRCTTTDGAAQRRPIIFKNFTDFEGDPLHDAYDRFQTRNYGNNLSSLNSVEVKVIIC